MLLFQRSGQRADRDEYRYNNLRGLVLEGTLLSVCMYGTCNVGCWGKIRSKRVGFLLLGIKWMGVSLDDDCPLETGHPSMLRVK